MSKAVTATTQSVDRSVLGVALRFGLYYAIAIALISVVGSRNGWNQLMLATTRVSTWLIVATGVPATQQGIEIVLPRQVLLVELACTAIYVIALYACLVLAYPLSWKSRLLGLAFGIPVIAAVNVLRIVAAAHASELLSPGVFAFTHDYLFQVGIVLVTVAVWAAWLSYVRRHAS